MRLRFFRDVIIHSFCVQIEVWTLIMWVAFYFLRSQIRSTGGVPSGEAVDNDDDSYQ